MPLIAEDGTGVPTANSYASEEDARSFHTTHGTILEWLELQAADRTVGALMDATAMLDARYAWRGQPLTAEQGLALPRVEFTTSDGRAWSPERQIAKASAAVSQLALQMLQGAGVSTGSNGGGTPTNITSERFPDYAVTYAGAKETAATSYEAIDWMLAPLYDAGGLSKRAYSVDLVRWS